MCRHQMTVQRIRAPGRQALQFPIVSALGGLALCRGAPYRAELQEFLRHKSMLLRDGRSRREINELLRVFEYPQLQHVGDHFEGL